MLLYLFVPVDASARPDRIVDANESGTPWWICLSSQSTQLSRPMNIPIVLHGYSKLLSDVYVYNGVGNRESNKGIWLRLAKDTRDVY